MGKAQITKRDLSLIRCLTDESMMEFLGLMSNGGWHVAKASLDRLELDSVRYSAERKVRVARGIQALEANQPHNNLP